MANAILLLSLIDNCRGNTADYLYKIFNDERVN